jgi:Zn-dependent alcohol dehydrogenase
VSVSVSASDNVGVVNVELYKDGTLFATLTNSPYTFSWDTTRDQDGSHNLVAKAYDAASNVGTSNTVAVSVDNTQPNVTIISPLSGAKVKGSVTISVSASDASGIQRVEFYIDGKLKASDYTAPYTYRWNTKTVKAGTHTILVMAYDNAGNMKQTSITVVSTGK